MDGGERWRVERCGGNSQDKSIINRIMLGFRPIAPKPAAGDSSSGGWSAANKPGLVAKGRTKRKYVRVCKKSRCRRKSKTEEEEEEDKDGVEKENHKENETGKQIVTLQLLPEKSDHIKDSASRVDLTVTPKVFQANQDQTPGFYRNFGHNRTSGDVEGLGTSVQRTAGMGPHQARVVESWVTVESLTNTSCIDARELGRTDAERMMNLEMDTCPCFVSDGCNRVQWINRAYRNMVVMQKNDWVTEELRVMLLVREELPYNCYGFTCQVKLQYTWQDGKWSQSQMVPCDVWRMDFGGFAWRLDVKAALTLGR